MRRVKKFSLNLHVNAVGNIFGVKLTSKLTSAPEPALLINQSTVLQLATQTSTEARLAPILHPLDDCQTA